MSSRYQIIGEINQGGVGVVLKAWDTKLSRHVAIKRFLSVEQRAALGSVDGDLLQEASTLSSLQHPNIVSVYDVDMDAPAGPEVIMEYLNGQDLEQAVAQAALTLEDFFHVAQQTLDALGNAHRMNLLHRDIKPSNIQVTWLANGKFVSKFVDFGLAKFFEKPSKQTVRQDGTVMGSVYYMAPEQFERQPLDHRSDIYSLGCVFYFALTMHRPFEGETVTDVINGHLHGRAPRLRDFRPNLPRDLEKWVEWLMNRQPDVRPVDAEIALSALRKIMAGELPLGVPGVREAGQAVTAAPMRTGNVAVPPSPAFVQTGARARPPQPPARTPAGRGKSSAVKKKSGSGAPGPWLLGGVAAAVAIGTWFLFSSSGKVATAGTNPERRASAVDILDAAKREAELHKTKAELAVTQARLAVTQASPSSTALPSSSSSPDLTTPPASGLVLWFDSAKGTRADATGKAAVLNGAAGQWQDIAANGGSAVFQYTASTTKDKEKNYPLLVTAPAGTGLKSPRPVLSFDGQGDTLCVRDRDKLGDPVTESLDGGNVSVLIVFRSAGGDADEGLLTARSDKKQTMWSLGVKDGGLVAGPAAATPLKIPGTEAEFRIASFVLDGAGGSIHLGLISSDGQKASGDTKLKVDTAVHLEMLRMGTSEGSGEKARSMFAGEIAEVLIYNCALDRETRHHAENFLRLKHFGSAAATVTANKR